MSLVTAHGIIVPQAVSDVMAERLRQDDKWGEQNHSPLKWLAIITEEIGEVAKEVLEAEFGKTQAFDAAHYRTELIHVAACAIAAIESLDRQSISLKEHNT